MTNTILSIIIALIAVYWFICVPIGMWYTEDQKQREIDQRTVFKERGYRIIHCYDDTYVVQRYENYGGEIPSEWLIVEEDIPTKEEALSILTARRTRFEKDQKRVYEDAYKKLYHDYH
jgi:hypothetical protein